MSRAFVKEDAGEGLEDLPDRPVSEHPNLVTAAGLALIEAEVARWTSAYAAAQAAADRAELARVARDFRYWSHRLQSAELMPEPSDAGSVQFGSRVMLERDDGRRVSYRIVGEDEADPAQGTVSYVAPLARQLMGKVVGDSVRMGAHTAEIVSIG